MESDTSNGSCSARRPFFEGEVEKELRRPKVWRFGREGNYSCQGGEEDGHRSNTQAHSKVDDKNLITNKRKEIKKSQMKDNKGQLSLAKKNKRNDGKPRAKKAC